MRGAAVVGGRPRSSSITRGSPRTAAWSTTRRVCSRRRRRASTRCSRRRATSRPSASPRSGTASSASTRQGGPRRPLYMYSDTRSAGEAEALGRQLDEAAVRARTGCPLHTSYWPAKLRWLAGGPVHGPARRGGAPSASCSPPSGWAGPSPASRWPRRPASSIRSARTGIPRCSARARPRRAAALPARGHRSGTDAPRALGEPVGGASARLCGIPPSATGAAGSVGSGCTDRTRVAINVGTSSAMRLVTDAPRERRRGDCGATGSTRAAPSSADPCPRAATCTRGAPRTLVARRAGRDRAGADRRGGHRARARGAPVPRGRAQPGLERARPGRHRGAVARHHADRHPARVARERGPSARPHLRSPGAAHRAGPRDRRLRRRARPLGGLGPDDRRCARPTARDGAGARGVEPRRGPARRGRARPAGRSRGRGSPGRRARRARPAAPPALRRSPRAAGPAVRRARRGRSRAGRWPTPPLPRPDLPG